MESTGVPAAVLVTGGAGYIGSHACKALARAGYLPVTVDNLSLGHRWAVKWGPLEVADVSETAALTSIMERHAVQAVIHFAASAYVGDSMRDPAAYYRNNLVATLSLMDAMRATGTSRLVFSSSCSVYGLPERLPIDESHPTVPVSPYGQTKLDCENAIRWYASAYGFRAVRLRYFNAAGADPDGEAGECHEPETRLVPRALFAALGRIPALDVFGSDYPTEDGTAVRDYVHVSDLAEAHVLALKGLDGDVAGRVVNLGTGRGYSVKEVIDAVQAETGLRVPLAWSPRRDGDPASVVAAASLAARTLSWEPRLSELRQIVRTAWKWHTRA